MNILIVYAHFEERSFNAALRDVAIATLGDAGHEVRVSDLYREGFVANPDPGQFASRACPDHFCLMREQAHAQQRATLAPDVAREQERIAWADAMILQFPLWWWSLPAILKGWVDRVLANGFAYGTNNLRGKSAMLSLTAETRAARLAGPFGAALFGTIEQGILEYCKLDVLPRHVAPELLSASDPERERMLGDYAAHLRATFAAAEAG